MATYQYTSKSGQVKTVQANSMSEAFKKAPDMNLSAPGGIKLLNQPQSVGGKPQPIQGFTQPKQQQGGMQQSGGTMQDLFGQLASPQIQQLINKFPQLRGAYSGVMKALVGRIESGQVINPDIKITPKLNRQFLKAADKELGDYKEQIGFLSGDFDRSLNTLQADYESFTQGEKQNYSNLVEEQATGEAEAGTAFSSGRVNRQGQLASSQQRRLDDKFRQYESMARDIGTETERTIGSKALKGIPTVQMFSAGVGGLSSSGSRKLYKPQGKIVGSLIKERDTKRENIRSQLEKNYRKNRVLNLQPYGGF